MILYFYFRDIKFEIKTFSRAMEYTIGSSMRQTITRLDVETDVKNFDIVEKLFTDQLQTSFYFTFNIELEPKGYLHQCKFSEYTLTDTKILFQLLCNHYDPNYINIKKQRKLKLKQLNN